jgi:argininosuccinate lyase
VVVTRSRKPQVGAVALWGGHFAHGPAPLMEQINASITFDKRLYAHDIAGSKAHAAMLAETGILSAAERDAIVGGLERIQSEIEAGDFPFSAALEDIHMNIEARLTELIGEPGRKLHTARSRNDQVATASSRIYRRRCWPGRRSTPMPRCRASPTYRRRSRSRSAII